MEEIAKLLKQEATLRLLVVGHTDNVGGFDANMTLSERRAAAVFQALTSKHGIAPARLRAVGVGMAAPVAANETKTGAPKTVASSWCVNSVSSGGITSLPQDPLGR